MSLFNLTLALKGPSPNAVTLKVRAFIYGFWKDPIQSIMTQEFCNEEVSSSWRNFEECGRESQNCQEQTLSRNLDLEDADGEGTEANEEHVFFWRLEEGGPCYIVAESLAKLSSGVTWKAEAEVINLVTHLRLLPRKVCKVLPVFFLLVVKCKRKEIN